MTTLVERYCTECHRIGFIDKSNIDCPVCHGKIERVNMDVGSE